MSCDNHSGESTYAKGGTIVLTKNDRYKIRTGKVLEFAFHGLQFNHRKIIFFVSNKANCPQQNSKLAKTAMKFAEVCPIIIDKEQMDILNGHDRVLSRTLECEPEYTIVVCTSEQYHQRVMEKNDHNS